jgi:hypothetical protein
MDEVKLTLNGKPFELSECIISLKNPGNLVLMVAYIFGISWVYDKFRKPVSE